MLVAAGTFNLDLRGRIRPTPGFTSTLHFIRLGERAPQITLCAIRGEVLLQWNCGDRSLREHARRRYLGKAILRPE